MMISVALVLATGCGNVETSQPPQTSTKKNSQPKTEPKAADQKPGTVLWEFETGFRVISSPAIGPDGTVYVGSDDFKVYALDGKSGAKKWEFVTGGGVDSSPALGANGILYVASWDNKVYAIQTSSQGLAKSPWPMRGQNVQHTGRALKQ